MLKLSTIGLFVLSLSTGLANAWASPPDLLSEQQLSQPSALNIVANVTNVSITLTRQEVRNIFMGDAQRGLKAAVLKPDNINRIIFNTKVIGLTESRIQSYWAQMQFSGRNKPPIEFDSLQSLLEYLQKNPGTVGYIPENYPIPDDLTILYTAR